MESLPDDSDSWLRISFKNSCYLDQLKTRISRLGLKASVFLNLSSILKPSVCSNVQHSMQGARQRFISRTAHFRAHRGGIDVPLNYSQPDMNEREAA